MSSVAVLALWGMLTGWCATLVMFLVKRRPMSYRERERQALLERLQRVDPYIQSVIIDPEGVRVFGRNPKTGYYYSPDLRQGKFMHSLTVPPRRAHMLIQMLCNYKDQEAIIGDLDELYWRRSREYGVKFAKRWYWWHTIRTVLRLSIARLLLVIITEKIKRLIP